MIVETIEPIPNSIKPILNDFIIKGKRFFYQRLLRITPEHENLIKLNNKIITSLAGISTAHFDVIVWDAKEKYTGYKNAEVILKRGYTKNRYYNYKIEIDLFNCIEDQNFEKAFANLDLLNTASLGLKCLRVPLEEIQAEYDELRCIMKKTVAFDLFNFLKQGVYYNKLYNAFSHKYDMLQAQATEIGRLWREYYPLKKGMKITYRDRTGRREGKVISRSNNWVTIMSSRNAEVSRYMRECSWKNKYEDTELYRCVEMLSGGKGIPVEWQEKKLEFYS